MPSWTLHGRTDVGRVRDNNEDCFALSPDAGLAILADGMGGHAAGEVASRLAVETVRRTLPAHLATLPPERALAQAIAEAHQAVVAAAAADRARAGMGTTLVVALFQPGQVYIAHVGDSRAYRLRDGRLALLSRDHTLAQERLDRGDYPAQTARTSPYRHVLTRAVGIDAAVQSDVRQEATAPQDLYLLCSDGLTDMLTDATIEALLTEYGDDLEGAADRLIQAANEAGGIDNITVVLARTS